MNNAKTDTFSFATFNDVGVLDNRIFISKSTLMSICSDMVVYVRSLENKSLYIFQSDVFFKMAGLEPDYKLIEAIADNKVDKPFEYEGYDITPIGHNLITVDNFNVDYPIPVDVFIQRAGLKGHDWKDTANIRDHFTRFHRRGETFEYGSWKITVVDENTVIVHLKCQRP